MHGALLESQQLPAGCNLKRAFVVAMLEHIDAGWTLGESGTLEYLPGSSRSQPAVNFADVHGAEPDSVKHTNAWIYCIDMKFAKATTLDLRSPQSLQAHWQRQVQ